MPYEARAGIAGCGAVRGAGQGTQRPLRPAQGHDGEVLLRPRPADSAAREGQLGRSRGGYGTKACVIADAAGRAVAFALAPGQAHEPPHAVPLLARLPGVPMWVVADRGYTPGVNLSTLT